ncbi:MAG: hypothetical protein R3F43_28940 [bacterium]
MSEAADQAWIALGGNIGPVAETLRAARLALRSLARGPLVISPLVETDPWGGWTSRSSSTRWSA